MRKAVEIKLTDVEKDELRKLSKGRCVSVRMAERAKVILLAADGHENKEIS